MLHHVPEGGRCEVDMKHQVDRHEEARGSERKRDEATLRVFTTANEIRESLKKKCSHTQRRTKTRMGYMYSKNRGFWEALIGKL